MFGKKPTTNSMLYDLHSCSMRIKKSRSRVCTTAIDEHVAWCEEGALRRVKRKEGGFVDGEKEIRNRHV